MLYNFEIVSFNELKSLLNINLINSIFNLKCLEISKPGRLAIVMDLTIQGTSIHFFL